MILVSTEVINQLLSNKSLPDPQITSMSQDFITEHSVMYVSGRSVQSSQKAFMVVTRHAGIFHKAKGTGMETAIFYANKFLQGRKLFQFSIPFFLQKVPDACQIA